MWFRDAIVAKSLNFKMSKWISKNQLLLIFFHYHSIKIQTRIQALTNSVNWLEVFRWKEMISKLIDEIPALEKSI